MIQLSERFWSKVDLHGPLRSPYLGPCWLWTAYVGSDGYGHFAGGGRRGPTIRAHRVAYELVAGAIPDGLQLDHLCRVRRCVNPAHLEPVTQAENIRRGVGLKALLADAAKRGAQTHCIRGHAFDEANTYRKPAGGQRGCRRCQAEYAARRRAA